MNNLILLIIVLLVIVPSGLYLLKRIVKAQIRRRAENTHISERDPLLNNLQIGKPALIYFTGAHCGPCKLVQSPIIQRLAKERADTLQIIEVDIEQQLDTALRWGVLKVPRTFILDTNLHVYASNLDVAMLPTLQQQILEAEQHTASPRPMKVILNTVE